MKFEKFINGILIAPLMIGGRALIYHEGALLHTSTIVAIRSSDDHCIRFETMDTIYILRIDPTPQSITLPAKFSSMAA